MRSRRAARICTSAAIGAAAAALTGCGGGDEEASPQLVAKAQQAYADAKVRGVDLSAGPCLGVIAPDWVADIAHDPRESVDDDPSNQCEAYRDGTAHHYVELDPRGVLIRSR